MYLQRSENWMIKIVAASTVLSVLVSYPFSTVYSKKIDGDDISNMIIEGENRLRVRTEFPEMSWTPQPFKGTLDPVHDLSQINQLAPPSLSKPPVILPKKIRSSKTAAPWLDQIFEPPILTLKIKKRSTDKKVKSIFLVKDSRGRRFYEKKYKGKLPEEVEWKGFGNNGEPMKVGYDYSYSLSTIDEGGNPQRHAGKPFRINALRYKKSRKTITSIQPELLFTSRSSIKLSNTGKNYLREVKDYLRKNYDKRIYIETYDRDQRFAVSRSKVVKDFLVNRLDLERERVDVMGFTMKQGGNYKHVDIIVK